MRRRPSRPVPVTSLKDVLALIALPPPTHGQSIVNAAIAARLAATVGVRAQVVDIGPGRLIRGLFYHLRRLSRVSVALGREFRHLQFRDRTLYTVVDAGWGIFYNFAVVGLARVLRFRIILHHHTAAHTLAARPLFGCLAKVAGRATIHVALGTAMAADLKRRYAQVEHVVTVHNACAVPAPDEGPRPGAPQPRLRLGFLSNLSHEKGVDVALEVLRAGRRSSLDLVLRLAGPVMTTEVSDEIERAKNEFGGALDILGPVSGEAKEDFFNNIDVFLFPSRYQYEAQPLVVIEAMGHGCALIVNDCGYTAELVDNVGAIVTDRAAFVRTALDLCRAWSTNREELQRQGRAVRSRFIQLRQRGDAELDRLIEIFVAGGRSCAAETRFNGTA